MTNEQALNKLDETVIGDFELKMVLSKALEKQITKEPIPSINKYTGNVNYYNCPNCNREVWENGYHTKYCESCGQALDWEVK
jgi:hypothetical protein